MERLQVIDAADPAELARTRAGVILGNPDLVSTEVEQRTLAELDLISEIMGFSYSSYAIKASHSFFIPLNFNQNEEVDIVDFNRGLIFSGELLTYGVVKIGRLAVADCYVRALCLVFSRFFILETMASFGEEREVPEGEAEEEQESDEQRYVLCTPAYAIEGIQTWK
ncbi:hypothetical protein F4X86_00290 [Candidatus Saccharibacteria bacterium]|nr:hypothetical protein [Candidatus Saccharibacteria bacterium]